MIKYSIINFGEASVGPLDLDDIFGFLLRKTKYVTLESRKIVTFSGPVMPIEDFQRKFRLRLEELMVERHKVVLSFKAYDQLHAVKPVEEVVTTTEPAPEPVPVPEGGLTPVPTMTSVALPPPVAPSGLKPDPSVYEVVISDYNPPPVAS